MTQEFERTIHDILYPLQQKTQKSPGIYQLSSIQKHNIYVSFYTYCDTLFNAYEYDIHVER